MKPHILIVDDDRLMIRMLTFLLNENEYVLTSLSDPRAVPAYIEEHPVDLVLLDIGLPHMDGLSLAALLRRSHPDISLIFLSARGQVSDTVEGFNHGGDDYISKPFEPSELLARIQAVLRRYRRAERNMFGTNVKVGGTSLQLGDLQFVAPGAPPAVLTPTEMKILEHLMRNAGAIVSRELLIERTWGYDYEGDSNRVDVYIRRIRKKIEPDPARPTFIHTVRGMGYVFRDGGHAA